jgi:hypothetical protein
MGCGVACNKRNSAMHEEDEGAYGDAARPATQRRGW